MGTREVSSPVVALTVWGGRGSIPASLSSAEWENRLTAVVAALQENPPLADADPALVVQQLPPNLRFVASGATSCVSVEALAGALPTIVFDAGSGIRALGERLLTRKEWRDGAGICHLFLSHLHWDHVQGFPFFKPLFIAGNKIHVYSAQEQFEECLRVQQQAPHFPVSLSELPAEIIFHQLEKRSQIAVGEARIECHPLTHPGGCSAFRVDVQGRSLVYATDSDFTFYTPEAYPARENLFSNVDALIFDAHFSLTDIHSRTNYGHCHAKRGVDIAVREGVKRLILFHHDPAYADSEVWRIFEDARAYARQAFPTAPLQIFSATDGQEFRI